MVAGNMHKADTALLLNYDCTQSIFETWHLYVRNCDLLCQNPPLTHTMAKNSFHCQWIALSIN